MELPLNLDLMSFVSIALLAIGSGMFIAGGRVWTYAIYQSWMLRRKCHRPRGEKGRFV